MSSKTLLFCLSLIVANHVESANILGIFPMFSPSHNIIHISLVRALGDAGHNITVVTSLPLKDKDPNYHHIHIEASSEEKKTFRELFHDMSNSKNTWETMQKSIKIVDVMNSIQQNILNAAEFQELLSNKGNHFDLVILGYGFNDYFLGVADHFKCPVIMSWVNVPMGGVNKLIGNPDGVSYIQTPMLGNGQMGFFKRVANMIFFGGFNVVLEYNQRKWKKYHRTYFPAEKGYRDLDEMQKNISLMFCCTHFTEDQVRPLVPNLIEIGGIQVKETSDPLPKDIQDFLQPSPDGFIFLSFGSNAKFSDINPKVTEIFFKILSARKEKVLWKWDDEDEKPGNASNIMFKKWFPQDDILAHSDVKLFITHCGKGSITESQQHGVPMLGVPIFGDQPSNANLMQTQGYGIVIDHRTITEEEFNIQLEQVLSNKTFTEAVKKYSNLYRDRPMTARQSVVYWTEYVLRHHGAKHMQSPLVHLNFFQANSLDVLGFLLVVLVVSFYAIKISVRFLKTLLCRKSKNIYKKGKKTE